jgi:hypothetical protein
MYSATPLSTLRKKDLRKIGQVCINYCIENLGVNKRKKLPLKLSIKKNPHVDSYFGEYCPDTNTIVIFYDELITLGEFTSTIVHEYTHHLQPIASKYYKLLKEHGYDNHPHEVEARNNEKFYNRRVLAYLRKNLP